MADTFDPSKKATNAVLSNGNLTVTTAPSAYSGALTQLGRIGASKGYAEFTVNSTGGTGAISFGVGDVLSNLANVAGTDSHSTGFSVFLPGFYYNGTSNTVSLGTISAGSRIDIAVDLGLPDLWIRGPSGLWNGNGTANPATGVNGLRTLYYSGLSALFAQQLYLMAVAYNSSQGTLNSGDTAFVGTPPSGFVAWNLLPPPPSVSTTFTSWSPTDISGVFLSGPNLTVTAATNIGGVRGVNSQAAGKFYWEYKFNQIGSNDFGAGIATATAPLNYGGGGGQTGPSVTIDNTNGYYWISAAGTPLLGNMSGATLCIAADLTGRLIWFRSGAAGNWNANAGNNPATGVGGISFASLGVQNWYPFAGFSGVWNGQNVIANFGDSAFIGVVPAGFTSGFTLAAGGASTTQARAMVLA